MTYTQIPTPAQFQKDSSISFAFRKDDEVLKHIDFLLERYQARNSTGYEAFRYAIMADLFLTCNFWIKSYLGGNTRTKKERYPAVLALREVGVKTLTEALGCGPGELTETLGEIYGRDMHVHGVQVDHEQNRARYLSKYERQVYRIRFRGGLAYQYKWWKGERISKELVPAESERAYSPIARKGDDGIMREGSKNFGCFVMTMDRELYMAKPDVGDSGEHNGFFHSSFTGGDVVIMAGTMLIKNGKIKGVRADSGHYKPTPTNMGLLLQGLAMYGVDLSRIAMYAWDGSNLGSGDDFIKYHMSWYQFERQRMQERNHRVATDNRRVLDNLAPRFPNLQPQVVGGILGQGGAPGDDMLYGNRPDNYANAH